MDKKYKFVIISNMPTEAFLARTLKKLFNENHLNFGSDYVSYEQYCSSDFGKPDVIVSLINIDILFPDILNKIYSKQITNEQIEFEISTSINSYIEDISSFKNALHIFFLFEDYYYYDSLYNGNSKKTYVIDAINQRLIELHNENVVFVDSKQLIAKLGFDRAYDCRYKYHYGMPYSKEMCETFSLEILKQFYIYRGMSKKCIVVDCDNVLWGGIVSEDGIENIKLSNNGIGKKYQDFQRLLLSLYYNGVIIAISSKNDLEDVKNVFQNHSGMILNQKHISVFKVNWRNKVESISEIASELNIGLESIVFIDDSQYEVDCVKYSLPEVSSVLFDINSKMQNVYLLFNLSKETNLQEIERRINTYSTNKLRLELKKQYKEHHEYIKQLNVDVEIHESLNSEWSRISELTQRTNRFTNGKRYTTRELREQALKLNRKMYSVFVKDKFSELGLVGVFEVVDNELTLFSLSCRSLGRDVEKKMVLFIQNNFSINKICFSKTGKNKDIIDFFNQTFSSTIIYSKI